MAFWQDAFMIFILLGLSHILCILAHRERGIIRTVGYTLAASLVILSILFIITEVDLSRSLVPAQNVTPKMAQHDVQAAARK